MMKLQVLVFLSLFTLISATTLSENNDSKILSEKRSGDLQNENPVKVLAQYDEAIHGPGKAFRMLGPEVDSFNRKSKLLNFAFVSVFLLEELFFYFFWPLLLRPRWII